MKQQRSLKSLLIKIVGASLVLLGIIGIFLPFLQGFLMISAGLAMLGNKKMKNFFSTIKKHIKKTYINFFQRKK
jgi:uncharacterized membrane protein YbaN (DUF454 family)